MREYVFCKLGQEKEFIARAQALNYTEIVLIFSEKDVSSVNIKLKKKLGELSLVNVLFGVLAETENKQFNKALFDEILQLGTSKSVVSKHITCLFDNENEEEKDFIHQRRSGLNHIVLTLCAEKNIKILFSYSALQEANDLRRAQILGRIKLNLSLCKKYGVEYSFASFTSEKENIRDAKDVAAFLRLLE